MRDKRICRNKLFFIYTYLISLKNLCHSSAVEITSFFLPLLLVIYIKKLFKNIYKWIWLYGYWSADRFRNMYIISNLEPISRRRKVGLIPIIGYL